MTTRATSRRVATLLAAITLIGAAANAEAQAPTKARAGTGKTLFADCDWMTQSCGGEPYLDQFGGGGGGGFGGGGYGDSGDGGPGPKYVCDGGNGQVCRVTVHERCVSWVVTSANGTVTVTVGTSNGGTIGGGGTRTCAETVTTTETIHLRKVS